MLIVNNNITNNYSYKNNIITNNTNTMIIFLVQISVEHFQKNILLYDG